MHLPVKYLIPNLIFSGQSKMIPILDPEFVAASVVSGVLANKQVVLLPWWAYILIALKAVMTEPAFMKISQVMGFNCSMDQFQGRQQLKSD